MKLFALSVLFALPLAAQTPTVESLKEQIAKKDLQIAQLNQQLHVQTMLVQLYERFLGVDVQRAQDDRAVKDAQAVMEATQKALVSKRTEQVQK
jgi:hypothetical protein